MKKVIITSTHSEPLNMRSGSNPEKMQREIVVTGGDDMQVSDGYHTFDELYDHRVELFIALCEHLSQKKMLPMHDDTSDLYTYKVWRSTAHSDGASLDGWFLLGIGKEKGRQITYHIPESRWEDCGFAEELVVAPEFDGHTSADVLERLKQL